MKAQTIRQGDVLLIPIKSLPIGAQPEAVRGDVILAHGEVTGHAHRIKDHAKVEVWSKGAARFIRAMEAVALTHEEHSACDLVPGVIYRQGYQVEERGEEVRRVTD